MHSTVSARGTEDQEALLKTGKSVQNFSRLVNVREDSSRPYSLLREIPLSLYSFPNDSIRSIYYSPGSLILL